MNWLKTHKLLLFISVIILVVLAVVSSQKPEFSLTTPQNADYKMGMQIEPGSGASDGKVVGSYPMPPIGGGRVANDTQNRITTGNSELSLLVKDVRASGDQVIETAKKNGGYMVSSYFSRPSESPFATIVVRVPTIKLDQILASYRSLAIKVTSENLIGEDVTDQFVDVNARMSILTDAEKKYRDILAKATTVEDIVSVQNQLTSLQEQIDNLKGQKEAIQRNVELSLVTVYLSTDELALPYAPDKTFRPEVVFKQSVRSLLSSLRVLGESVIWVAVYSVVWGPIVAAIILYRKWRHNTPSSKL